jgi:hypothetical protein
LDNDDTGIEIVKSFTVGEADGFAAVAKPMPGSLSKKYSKAVMSCALVVMLKAIKK